MPMSCPSFISELYLVNYRFS